jgi:hypothetical protein
MNADERRYRQLGLTPFRGRNPKLLANASRCALVDFAVPLNRRLPIILWIQDNSMALAFS